jgi:hypothetical protein
LSVFANFKIPPPQTETTTVEFGEWLPDLSPLNNPGATEALNVIPTSEGYGPFRDISPVAGLSLPASCKGAIVLSDRTQTIKIYAATVTDLYVREGAGFTSLYSLVSVTSDADLWQFIPFGDNLVAIHPQADTVVATISTNGAFAPLGGNPPRALCGARVGDFLVLGNLDNENDPSGARQAQRIRWSAFNSIDSPWITDPNTQADFNDMPSEGGAVTGIVGRETGTVFQERQISRMTEVGLPTVFDIVTVEQERGALCAGGVVDGGAGTGFTGTCIYFIAQDGFYLWNGYSSQSISNDKVNNYFFTRVNMSLISRITGALDLKNSCVWWAFPTLSSPPRTVDILLDTESGSTLQTEDGQDLALEATTTDAPLSEILIYSFKNQRWAHAVTSIDFIMSSPSSTLPISLDDLLGDLDTDYTISFDDISYQTGGVCVAGFNDEHTFGPYNGFTLAAIIDTAESSAPTGKRVFVSGARPLVDTDQQSVTVQTITRDQTLGGPLNFSTAVPQEITGECPILDEARYMRFRTNIPYAANWQHALGIEITRTGGGEV